MEANILTLKTDNNEIFNDYWEIADCDNFFRKIKTRKFKY